MNTGIVVKDLMKPHFQIKNPFTVNYISRILLTKIIHMLKKYSQNSYLQT